MKGITVLIAGIIAIITGAICLSSGGPGLFSTVFMVITLMFWVILAHWASALLITGEIL